MNQNIKGALLTMGGAICWGLSGAVGQYLFTYQGMDARWLVPVRLICAGIILFFYCFFTCREKLFQVWKKPRSAVLLLIYGLAGITLCQYTYFRAIQLSSAGVATILQDFAPVIVLICTCIMAKRLPRTAEILSIILALAGLFLIVTHGNIQSLSISLYALAVGLLSATTVALYNLLAGSLTCDYPVPVLQAWSFFLGGIMLGGLFRSWAIPYTPSLIAIFGVAFVTLAGNVFGFTMYVSGLKYISPNKGVLYTFAEPVAAAISSTLALGSPFTIWDAAGFACVFAMLVMISISKADNKNR